MTPPTDLNKFYPPGSTGTFTQEQLLHVIAGLLQQLSHLTNKIYDELGDSSRKTSSHETTFEVKQLKERVDELYRAVISGNFGKPGLAMLTTEHGLNIDNLQDADMNLEKTIGDVQSRVMALERSLEKDAGKNFAWGQAVMVTLSILSILTAVYAALK